MITSKNKSIKYIYLPFYLYLLVELAFCHDVIMVALDLTEIENGS